MKKSIFFFFVIASLLVTNNIHSQTVFAYGDSHVGIFRRVPECLVIRDDSYTMYRIGRDQINALNISNLPIRNGDAVMFCFGQVDVGWHISKQLNIGRNLNETIETIVVNYLDAIDVITAAYPNLIKIVYSVPPASEFVDNPAIPYTASLKDRILFTKKLNSFLEALCPNHNIEFLNAYDSFADREDVLRKEVRDISGYHIDWSWSPIVREKLLTILSKY